MKRFKAILWLVLPAVLAGALVIGIDALTGDPRQSDDAERRQLRSKSKKAAKAAKARSERRIRAEDASARLAFSPEKDEKAARAEELKALLAKAEEDKLTEEEREVIDQLRELLNGTDVNGTRLGPRAVSARLAEILDFIKGGKASVALRKATLMALQGLASTASAGSGEGLSAGEALLDFLADSDPEVSNMALQQFQEAVSDFTMSDRDRAKLVIAASLTVNDESSLSWVFSEIVNMRHSVAVDTMATIATSGTEAARTKIVDTMYSYTGSEDVKTPESARQWLSENPDSPYDEEFYGGANLAPPIVL